MLWCVYRCGYIDAGIIPKFSLCSIVVKWFQASGQFMDSSYILAEEEWIFFDRRCGGSIDHVWIVINVKDGFVNTLERNSCNKVQRGEGDGR